MGRRSRRIRRVCPNDATFGTAAGRPFGELHRRCRGGCKHEAAVVRYFPMKTTYCRRLRPPSSRWALTPCRQPGPRTGSGTTIKEDAKTAGHAIADGARDRRPRIADTSRKVGHTVADDSRRRPSGADTPRKWARTSARAPTRPSLVTSPNLRTDAAQRAADARPRGPASRLRLHLPITPARWATSWVSRLSTGAAGGAHWLRRHPRGAGPYPRPCSAPPLSRGLALRRAGRVRTARAACASGAARTCCSAASPFRTGLR